MRGELSKVSSLPSLSSSSESLITATSLSSVAVVLYSSILLLEDKPILMGVRQLQCQAEEVLNTDYQQASNIAFLPLRESDGGSRRKISPIPANTEWICSRIN